MVKKLLLLCSIFFLSTNLSYSQQLNAEIFYQGTSQTSYDLTLTIVDKCNGSTRGSSVTIYCSNAKKTIKIFRLLRHPLKTYPLSVTL